MRRCFDPLLVALIALTVSASADAATSFRVEVSGHGRPIILIPGLASSGDTWKTTVARYQDRYTCHVLTLAGFAGVPAIDAPLMATVRAELVAYIHDQHLDKPIVIGHSLGGTLALDLASREPNLVGPIVIVDALPFLAGAQFQAKTVAEAKPMLDQMHKMMTMASQSPEQSAQYLRGPNAPAKYMVTSAADFETVAGWGVASNGRAVADAMLELMSMDLREDVAKIQSPALVLGTWSGLHDQLKAYGVDLTRAAVVQTFEQQFAKLPRLHFALAETARHFIMFDDPQWFFAQLDAFLADPAKSVSVRGFSPS